jgi:type IV pilus assembly protein PilC
MLLFRQLPLSGLIELCRALRYNLQAGIMLRDVFRQQAAKGPARVRPVAERIRQDIERGDSLEAALKREKDAFPPIFLALATVGEQTGNLPEVFQELEKYFLMQQRLRREFLAQAAWPALQLVAAILVIALLLWILGMIAEFTSSQPLDPLGLGLTGVSGAIIFLCISFGSLAGIGLLYLLVTRTLKQKTLVDRFLLRLWVIGPTLRALALTRFCLALRLTMETGMSITSALRLSLRATGNAAFADRTEVILESLRAGDDLTVALGRSRLFPEEFQNIVAVAEESGQVPESMRHQAQYYEEEAGRRMAILTRVAGFLVWLLVAVLIIVAIIRIFMIAYLGPINQLLEGRP